MKRFWTILWSGILLASIGSAAPKVTYVKSFPGSVPAYVEITVDQSGKTEYKETKDDDPEILQLEPNVTSRIFELALTLDDFKRPLESGLKIANMGSKTFTWEDGSEKHQVTFNYSTDEDAKELWDWFERVSESEREALTLDRSIRHDKLGVNAAVVSIQITWDRKRLVGTPRILPLLDQVAGDEKYMHMSRARAAGLAEAIRASGVVISGKSQGQ